MRTAVSEGDAMRWWRHSPGRRVVLAGGVVALFGVLGAWWALARVFEEAPAAGPPRLQESYVRVDTAGEPAGRSVHDPNGAP